MNFSNFLNPAFRCSSEALIAAVPELVNMAFDSWQTNKYLHTLVSWKT